jgi:hypothetical protein
VTNTDDSPATSTSAETELVRDEHGGLTDATSTKRRWCVTNTDDSSDATSTKKPLGAIEKKERERVLTALTEARG